MMGLQQSDVTTIRNNAQQQAVVFLHGFSGARDDTWDRFPGLLGTATASWDIFTVGYATTLLPDLVGVWSADPDLPILATMFRTQLGMPPFDRYQSLALVAHSMGGLIVQKALVDDSGLAARVRHVILFGTPSAGLAKAGWVPFWKRQLKNMARDSDFIRGLRQRWDQLYTDQPPFNLLVVAGASDQFVPPVSSIDPFAAPLTRVVAGDHISIVKPADAEAPSLTLLRVTLDTGAAPKPDQAAQLRMAAERLTPGAPELVQAVERAPREMSVKEVVDAALALDRAGKRPEAVALLERNQERDTDIKGTLGGRKKRLWMETNDPKYGEEALAHYKEGLDGAIAAGNGDQIYYLAINVAFMRFVFSDDAAGAREMAELALTRAAPAGVDVWKTATVAEAYLYLGRKAEALAEYTRLLTLQSETWKHQSTALQAARIAAKLGDQALAEELESIFNPNVRRVNRIFVSYSHKDTPWLERLETMAAPYLHTAETELDLWIDTRIQAGADWNTEIQDALSRAGVVVALVSANFLASRYVAQNELPAIVKAAKSKNVRLLWVYISSAGYEETPLKEFQATHDVKAPLDTLPVPQQNEILKSVARQMKEAALGATDRFKVHAS